MKTFRTNIIMSIFFVFFWIASTIGLEGADTKLNQMDNEMILSVVKLAKIMLDSRADQSVIELFGGTFDPRNSRIIGIKEIHDFINEEKIIIKMLPQKVQQALKDKNTTGLLVSKFNRKPGVPYRMSEDQRAVMLTWLIEDDWIESFWIQGVETGGENDDDGPCNGEYTQNCVGCEGWENGVYRRCRCINSCVVNRPCLPCLAPIPVP